MILVDTSVWIEHLRAADARLVELLGDDEAGCHPLVIEELAAWLDQAARRCSRSVGQPLPVSGGDPRRSVAACRSAAVVGSGTRCRRCQPSWFGGSGWRRATMDAGQAVEGGVRGKRCCAG
ncbi:hypothetical protein MRGA423_06965 [Mycobacterium tuberculosis RGTB423]|nr:hypothetical protein MRGA423_06965 [Mycobacterium tuberculosis RGTB423]